MNSKEKIDFLEKLLISAYKNPPHVDIPEQWHQGVMREIRRVSRQEQQPCPALIERLFPVPILFKYAGISATCALMFMVFFLTSRESIDLEFTRLFLNDPFGMATLALLVP